MGDMEEKGMAVAAEGVGAPGERGGEEEGSEVLVKSAPNDELNSKVAHDAIPGDADESVAAVAGSVDGSVEARDASVNPEAAPSGDVVDAAEKVESWDLSEAVAKTVQDGAEKGALKPKISEEGLPPGVDGEVAPVVSIDSIEDSVEGAPVAVSSHVEDKAADSEHAGGVTEVPSEAVGGEDVCPEIPAEGLDGNVDSEAVDVPVEEDHEVVEATKSADPVEGAASLEAVPSPSDDVEAISGEVNSNDVVEVPSESVDKGDGSSEIPAEGPFDDVDREAVDAPADSEKLDARMGHEAVEPINSASADERAAEPESVSASDDVEEKSVEVNIEDTGGAVPVLPAESAENEDVSPEHPPEGPSDIVDGKALDAPVDSGGPLPQMDDEVVKPTSSAGADEGTAESEPVSASVDVEEKSAEVNYEDTSDANTLESAVIDDVGPEIPAAGPSDNVDSEALEDPVDSRGLDPEAVHEVVEPTSVEADEGSVEPESVSAPAGDTEEKSIEVNPEDTSEENTVLPSENSVGDEDVSREPEPAEGSVDNVGNDVTLYAPAEEVHEVVESTINAEPREESAEPEPMSVPPHDVEDKSVDVNSGDASEATTPLESADNEVAGSELPAEELADNVGSDALEPEAVHEVAEPTTSAESAEPEDVSAVDHVEDKSIEVNSEDTSEAATVIPSNSPAKEVDSSELPAESIDQIGETAGASIGAKPIEESTETVSVSAPPSDIEDKSVVLTEVSTDLEGADKEVVSSVPPAGEPADNANSGALDAEELHEVVEPTTSKESVKESAEPEFLLAPSDNVDDKSTDLNSKDVTEVTTASEPAHNEDVSPEPTTEEPSANVGSDATFYAPVEEVHEVVEETISAEPNEESAEPESMPSPSYDVDDGFVMVNSRDVPEASTEFESADNEIVSRELPVEGSADNVSNEAPEPEAAHEVVKPTTSAEPEEESAEPELVSAPDHVEDKSIEVNSEDTSEAVTLLPSESAGNEVISSEPPAGGSADKVDAPVEEIGELEDAVTNSKSDEVSASLEFVAAPSDDAQSMPNEVEPEVLAPEREGESIMATSIPFPVEEDKSDLDHEHEQSEVDHEGSVENQIPSSDMDMVADSKETDTAENTSEELLGGVMSGGAPESHLSEEPSDLSIESHGKSLSPEDGVTVVDRCIQMEELPHGSAAESRRSVSMDAEVNAGDEGIAQGGDIIKEESLETQSVIANEDSSGEDVSHMLQTEMTDEEAAHVATQPIEDVSHVLETEMTDEEAAHVATQPVEDLSHVLETEITDGEAAHVATQLVEDASHLLQTVMTDEEAAHIATQPVEDVSHLLQTVMTDEEVKSAAAHHPEKSGASEESVEDNAPPLESENSRGEPLIPPAEYSGLSQANEGETVSREFNFNDSSEAPTTSEVVRESGDESHDAVGSEQVTPYLASALAVASGGNANSSDAAASDTTQLEISSPPVVEKEVAPRSYNLDAVATNLHDAAEKALEDAKSSNIGDAKASVAQSVAQIVLDESSKTGDSSEYISGVVQDVAQLAQDAASSDPSILPDIVARVFDGETEGSPANETSEPKETTSLGTMVSLFIVWCVSLCASHISSKDMPAPALKLAAEEVTAVLHSNATSQPAPSHEAASSNN